MSRRAATIEEVFEDDTDLPLPHRPLTNTGTRGAILTELSDDDASEDDDAPAAAGPASPSQPMFRPPAPRAGDDENRVTDITPYKKWTCVYPIYIDAKRPAVRGERRIARSKSVWWPLSKDIADVTSRLGLGTLHEVHKSHPRDWENPGRVRVQWKKDGRLLHPGIKNKKQLLEMISTQIQVLKPDGVPRPPYTNTVAHASSPAPSTPDPSRPSTPAQSKSSTKGKATAKAKAPPAPLPAPAHLEKNSKARPKPPQPPAPWPPLSARVSPYSPTLPSGVLIETIKAGMSAQEANPAVGAGGGKGKRKVVRVRG